jgi:hypothetical protein
MLVCPWDRHPMFWEGWKRVSRAIGTFQARVLLTILYATVVVPFGIGVRLFSDPLRIRHRPKAWLDRAEICTNIDWARRNW